MYIQAYGNENLGFNEEGNLIGWAWQCRGSEGLELQRHAPYTP